jgi:hypothetical protein
MRRHLLTIRGAVPLHSRVLFPLRPFLVDLRSTNQRHVTLDWWPDCPSVPSPRLAWVEEQKAVGATQRVVCRFAGTQVDWLDHASDAPPGFKPPWVVECGVVGASANDAPPGGQLWYDAEDIET